MWNDGEGKHEREEGYDVIGGWRHTGEDRKEERKGKMREGEMQENR